MVRLLGAALLLGGSLMATSAAARANPFGIAAVNNAQLGYVTGGAASAGFARNARAFIDQSTRSTFDATASINRVTFDNWFAREGADLISAGALGRPLMLN